MFEHQHYVPVLRIKPAELRALRASDPVLRSRVTPILECPPGVLRGCDTLVKLERRFDRIVSHISGWSGPRCSSTSAWSAHQNPRHWRRWWRERREPAFDQFSCFLSREEQTRWFRVFA
jgi:hypothetical protein